MATEPHPNPDVPATGRRVAMPSIQPTYDSRDTSPVSGSTIKPWRYASNNHDAYVPPPCPRCGGVAQVEWLSVEFFSDGGRWDFPGRHWCTTPGCVDDKGSNAVPSPPAGES